MLIKGVGIDGIDPRVYDHNRVMLDFINMHHIFLVSICHFSYLLPIPYYKHFHGVDVVANLD